MNESYECFFETLRRGEVYALHKFKSEKFYVIQKISSPRRSELNKTKVIQNFLCPLWLAY